MRNFTHRWPQSEHFSRNLGTFFQFSKKGRGDLPLSDPPSGYAPVKQKFFVKEKKISFIKKPFLQDTNYSCTAIFIIHTFISYILTHYSSALNRSSFPETLCYELNEVIDVIHCFLSKKIFFLLKSLCYALN